MRDLDHLAAILRSLLPCWDRCIVRGAPIDPDRASGIRRLLHRDPETGDEPTLYETPRRWVAIDVDGIPLPPGVLATDIEGCARVAIRHLPVEFHGKKCVAVATAQHGIRPDIRLRLCFWLDGVTTLEVRLNRGSAASRVVDLCTIRPVQCIYVAAPVLADGVPDPVPDRLVVLPGEPLVSIRPLPTPKPRETPRVDGSRPRPPSGGCPDRYRDAALTGIAGTLMATTEGGRHVALTAAAAKAVRTWPVRRLANRAESSSATPPTC